MKKNSYAKLNIPVVFLSKNSKNEYQRCISSTSNTNFTVWVF